MVTVKQKDPVTVSLPRRTLALLAMPVRSRSTS